MAGWSRRSRWLWWVALATVLAVLPTVWGLSYERSDPRAYPGSHSQSLDESLDAYNLRLPECAQDGARFAYFRQFTANSFTSTSQVMPSA